MSVFVGLPAAIVLFISALAYFSGGARRAGKRYRPGRPFEFTPVWFLSAPARLSVRTGAAEVTTGPHREALAGALAPPTGEASAPVAQGVTGGASDRW